jgi:peptidyl-prolyl cis-trans isomerase SurA
MIKSVSVLMLACLAAAVQAQGIRLPHSSLSSVPQRSVAPRSSAPEQADFIVAVVNSEPITNNEVRARTARALQQFSQQGVNPPPMAELTRQVLERIISEKAQAQLAVEMGMKVEDSALDLAEQNVARQNKLTVTELHDRLLAEGTPVQQMRDDLRNQILLARLRDREMEARVKVTDSDVEQFLQEQQAANTQLLQDLNIAQVLVAVPEGAPETKVAELKSRAERIVAQAKAGVSFANLARDYSDGMDKDRGGEMGMRPVERYPELFVNAVQGLPVDAVVGPLRSPAGFHILKLLDKRESSPSSMTVTQTHARHILLRTSPKLSESAALSQLEGYRRRIVEGGASFADLARDYSQDGSAKDGGDLGWANPGQFVPEFEEVLNTLQPNQVSQPFVSRFGAHLIQLLERRESKLSSRDQREIARNILREKKTEEAYGIWVQEVRGRAYVEFRDAPI